MKITVDGKVAQAPFNGAPHVVVDGAKCGGCGASPLLARSDDCVEGHDRYEGHAYCVGCKHPAGKLLVVVSTIFGIEEDRRVLNGRARVY